jgi:hypothetical protein
VVSLNTVSVNWPKGPHRQKIILFSIFILELCLSKNNKDNKNPLYAHIVFASIKQKISQMLWKILLYSG